MKNSDKKNNKNDSGRTDLRRRKLFSAVFVVLALLAVLYIVAEYLLPKFSSSLKASSEDEKIQTRIFYDEDSITEEDFLEYDLLIKDIYYKKDGVELLVTDGNFYEVGGNAAVMFSKYIDAIKNGDKAAYAECFSEKYNFENGLDRFASGENDFPPQRLYDIKIEVLDEYSDKTSGVAIGLYCVTYRIWRNTGDFRSDMGEDTAPLIFTTEETDGKVTITNIAYRYGA